MKINLNFLKRIFRQKIIISKKLQSQRHWVITLSFFLLVSVGIVVFSLSLYLKIDKGEIFLSGEIKGETVEFNKIERDELTKVINSFNKRAEKLEEIKKEDNDIVDPSL
jgi:sensor histidine kinase YesM